MDRGPGARESQAVLVLRVWGGFPGEEAGLGTPFTWGMVIDGLSRGKKTGGDPQRRWPYWEATGGISGEEDGKCGGRGR